MSLSVHYLGTIFTENTERLLNSQSCIKHVVDILENEDVQTLGHIVSDFDNKSYTVVFSLAESHISIHTWPEKNAVQIDVFLCNYFNDNTKKSQKIFESICDFFDPYELEVKRIKRR
jgi:S-adenosylmethionine decarboxylase